MSIYWLFWLWICICNIVFLERNRDSIYFSSSYSNSKKIGKVFFFITMIGVVIFVGLRYQVGGDWFNYILIYEKYAYLSIEEVIWDSRDIGYAFLNFFGQRLGFKDTIFVNFVCSIIIVFCLLKIANYLKLYWVILMVYFPYHLLVVSNGYTRQSVAIACSLVLFVALIEKKVSTFCMAFINAILFHQTAILLLLFFPIFFLSNQKKIKYSNFYIFYVFLSGLILLIMLIYLSRTDNIYVQDNMDSKGFILRWTYHFIPILIYLRYRKYFQLYNKYIFDLFLFFIFLVAVIGFFYSTLSDRFNLYLIFFDIYMVLFVFKSIAYTTFNKYLLLLFMVVFYTILIAIWIFAGEWASRAWIPYSNYLFNFYRDLF